MRPSQLLAAVVALSSVSAAWPDAVDNVKAVAEAHAPFFARQDNQDSSSEVASKTQSNDEKTTDAPKSSSKASATDKDNNDSSATGKATGSNKPSGTDKGTTKKPTPTNIDPRLPAGGVSMVTPAPISGAQFYKIGDWVTFAWNYTSLSVSPSHVDILATCSANQATYTLAVNQSIQASTILWDTGAYQASATVPLLTETYTLMIYDAESSVSATAKAGYLAVFNQFTFGMYTPQPYVDWKDFNCANCVKNSAGFLYDSLTLKMLMVSGFTTIASFIYFANAFGLI